MSIEESFKKPTYIETELASDSDDTNSLESLNSDYHAEDKYPYIKFPRKSMYVQGFRPAKPVRIILFEAKYRMPERKPVIKKTKAIVKYDLPQEDLESNKEVPMEHNYKITIAPSLTIEAVPEPKPEPKDEGWTKVKNTKKDKPEPVSEIRKQIPNRLCRYKSSCRRKDTCPYAHSLGEIKVNDCPYKSRCRYIILNPDGVYTNKPTCNRPCNLIHPNEPIEAYLKRVMIK